MMEDFHNIAVIPGDLNGITVTEAALKVSDALSHLLKKPIKHTRFDYNADYYCVTIYNFFSDNEY